MPDMLSLLQCLLPQINATTMRRLNQIILAMLALSGRVTMLGITRWTGAGADSPDSSRRHGASVTVNLPIFNFGDSYSADIKATL